MKSYGAKPKQPLSPIPSASSRWPTQPRPTMQNFIFARPVYRKLSQHRKASIRALSRVEIKEASTRQASVTERTLSPNSFLLIGREGDGQNSLTLLYQKREIMPGYSNIRLAHIKAWIATRKRPKKSEAQPISTKHPQRQRSLHAFRTLPKPELLPPPIRRQMTVLPALQTTATHEDQLGPWDSLKQEY